MSYFDCIVIGAGVAGMTSAIYLKRYNLDVLLIEKGAPGGQITQTPNVENYPGYSSIDGASLALNIFSQVNHLGVSYQYGNVIKIENLDERKIVYTDNGIYETKSIIIASGRKPKKLGLEKENQLIGNGISWCATCDGMFYKNQHVAVIGGGNSAIEEALFLSEICEKVDVLYRGENLRADAVLQQKVFEKNNIEIHYNTEVQELIEEKNKLMGIKVEKKENIETIWIEGLFIYIGYEPDTDFLSNLNLKFENQYIVVNENMETNISGVYACGDVIKKELYQLTTAVGEASLAAYQVKKFLENVK
ncbi:MAG: FAD-dependent oxidoreductase [Bacilli bacterium]|nr:FAD-dependent oxidoreductase [Bacilli bacterium]